MQILPISSTYCNSIFRKDAPEPNSNKGRQVNFKNMTRVISKEVYGKNAYPIISQLRENETGIRGLVGELPEIISMKLTAKNQESGTREILSAFDQVAHMIRNFSRRAIPDEAMLKGYKVQDFTDFYRPLETEGLLNEVFHKYDIIPKKENIELQFNNKKGHSSKGFLIKGLHDSLGINDDDFFIKVFNNVGEDCYRELNCAQYWMTNVGSNTQKGKFYFGNLDSGYMVEKYIDEDCRPPARFVSIYSRGLGYDGITEYEPLPDDMRLVKNYTRYTHSNNDKFTKGNLKGYNYRWSGIVVVNKIKHKFDKAREWMENVRDHEPATMLDYWNTQFSGSKSIDSKNEDKLAGLTLGIKNLAKKNLNYNEPSEKALAMRNDKIDQALCYVLKYLPEEDAKHYFGILAQRENSETQNILFGEIGLLAKYRDKNVEVKDDINVALKDIVPSKLREYCEIASEYCLPENKAKLQRMMTFSWY